MHGDVQEIISPSNLYLQPKLVFKQYEFFWRLVANLCLWKMGATVGLLIWVSCFTCSFLPDTANFPRRTLSGDGLLTFSFALIRCQCLDRHSSSWQNDPLYLRVFCQNHTFEQLSHLHDGHLCLDQATFYPYEFLGSFHFYRCLPSWGSVGLLCPRRCSAWVDLLGMIAGHAYFFLEDVCPRMTGWHPLRTPSFIKALFADEAVVVARPENVRFAAPPAEELHQD
ncbi:hypothetical protein MLD38_021074 [Melastoma candidum]|uniref:Uncharacterized protein n=1 Tax=Melastoma candidum TaxID=119954 RepID=A0ACB9QEU7_9MYRT|nr:hypothetical protein MLD38_021074 [Melastoma candidum]